MVHDDGYMYASEWGLIVALPSTVGPANLVCPGVSVGRCRRAYEASSHVGRKARGQHE